MFFNISIFLEDGSRSTFRMDADQTLDTTLWSNFIENLSQSKIYHLSINGTPNKNICEELADAVLKAPFLRNLSINCWSYSVPDCTVHMARMISKQTIYWLVLTVENASAEALMNAVNENRQIVGLHIEDNKMCDYLHNDHIRIVAISSRKDVIPNSTFKGITGCSSLKSLHIQSKFFEYAEEEIHLDKLQMFNCSISTSSTRSLTNLINFLKINNTLQSVRVSYICTPTDPHYLRSIHKLLFVESSISCVTLFSSVIGDAVTTAIEDLEKSSYPMVAIKFLSEAPPEEKITTRIDRIVERNRLQGCSILRRLQAQVDQQSSFTLLPFELLYRIIIS